MDTSMETDEYTIFPSKFSSIDAESDEDKQSYLELEKFVYYMAWKSDGNNVLMEAEEIVGELLLEMVKGLRYYKNLHGAEKIRVLKTMLSHRMGELNHRFYGTHRKAAKLTVSLEMDESAENTPDWDTPNPEQELINKSESLTRVYETRSMLSSTAQRVFDTVIYGNDKLEAIMKLSAMRSNAVFQFPTMSIKCWMVAQALLIPVADVEQAFNEIKQAYAEVCDGTN